LTIAKSKSSRLSYSEVVSQPLESILSKISRYDVDKQFVSRPHALEAGMGHVHQQSPLQSCRSFLSQTPLRWAIFKIFEETLKIIFQRFIQFKVKVLDVQCTE
jgi:hypothetical protein